MAAKLIALVVPLGLDTFAVAAALGAIGGPPRRRARISLVFTAFEAGMPIVGLALGAPLGHALGAVSDYVAISVLLAFGLYTLIGPEESDAGVRRLTEAHGGGVLLLGLSVSLDELAIGFTLGLLRLPVVLVVVLIALQAFVVTQLGLALGSRLAVSLREGAERLAGVALTALALVLLVSKVLA